MLLPLSAMSIIRPSHPNDCSRTLCRDIGASMRARRRYCSGAPNPAPWASIGELDEITHIALRVNDFLTGLFLGINIRLIDLRLNFGRLYSDDEVQIVIADEISPDHCRLWDSRTQEKMDKDRFREDLGRVEEGYQEVARRLGIVLD